MCVCVCVCVCSIEYVLIQFKVVKIFILKTKQTFYNL